MNLPDDVTHAAKFFNIEDEPSIETDPHDRPEEEDEDERNTND